MTTWLRVIAPFGDYAAGDTIKDASKVAELQERRDVVVPVLADDLPKAPKASAAPATGGEG